MTRRHIPEADAAHSDSPVVRRTVPVWVQRILGPLACASVVAACIFIGVLPVIACVRSVMSGATLVTLYPRDAVTIPLCFGFTFFGGMFALPDPQIRLRPSRRSPTARRANRVGTVLFAAAGLSMLLVPFAPLLASAGLAWIAADHAYVACPPPTSNRYGATRWARDHRACPMESARRPLARSAA